MKCGEKYDPDSVTYAIFTSLEKEDSHLKEANKMTESEIVRTAAAKDTLVSRISSASPKG